MNIAYHDYRAAKPTISPVTEYVADWIKHGNYDDGDELERAQATANRAARAVSTLVDILASKGVLTVEQVVEIAGGYHGMDKVKPTLAP